MPASTPRSAASPQPVRGGVGRSRLRHLIAGLTSGRKCWPFYLGSVRWRLAIKDPDTDALARRLASLTGEKITDAVRIALQERVDREEQCRNKATLAELKALVEEFHRLMVVDPRTPDEIIGYDDLGLPA